MKITNDLKEFVRGNKQVIIEVINSRLADFKDASINDPTVEGREKARLLALEFQQYISLIEGMFKSKKKKKDFTGI